MSDRLGPWGEIIALQGKAADYAEATLSEPLRAELARKAHVIAVTVVVAVIASVLAFTAGDFGLSAAGSAAGNAAYMLYHDRYEPRRVQLGMKIAASFDGRSAVVENLWQAIDRRARQLMVLRVATLALMAALIVS